MKTEKELNELKEKVKNMKQKLAELTEEELGQVIGGAGTCDILIDEDKARERAEFEKALIYEQRSQGMLAQANPF